MKKTIIYSFLLVFFFTTENLSAQWAQITVSHNGGTQVYNIPTSGLINWQPWHNCPSGPKLISNVAPQGWTWTDNLPAGTVVTSVEVTISFDASGTAAPQPYLLNGVPEGSSPGAFNINGVCVPDYKTLTLPGTNYIVGGQNTFTWILGAYTFTIIEGSFCSDADGDGYNDASCGGNDCDDNDASINPGAAEVCDGIDNNCDGQVDEGFTDTDNDGLADCIDPDDDNDGCLDGDDANPLTASGDSDCDGVADDCDVCPDGDDSVDNNNDGTPDCSQLLNYNQYSAAWKCGNNKINICHNGNTLCINKNALPAHFNNHGDAVGPCQSCGGSNMLANPNESNQHTHFEVQELEVFPNPAKDEINIHLHGMEAVSELVIYDQLGRAIWTVQLQKGQHSTTISLDDKPFDNGIYLISAVSKGEVITQRLVITK